MRPKIKQLLSNTSGNFAITASLTLFVMVGGIAMAVDGSRAISSKSKLQDVSDQVSVAAAIGEVTDQAELEGLADAMFSNVYGDDWNDSVVLESIARNDDTVTVIAKEELDTRFAQIFGKDVLDVRAAASATYKQRLLDLALVLDNTGSMQTNNKIGALKEASEDLVDILFASPQASTTTQVGLVPFSTWVNVGTDTVDASWLDLNGLSPQNETYFADANVNRLDLYTAAGQSWDGCVENRLPPFDVDDTAPDPNRPETYFQPAFNAYGNAGPATRVDASCADSRAITPLTNNVSELKDGIDGMSAQGWTNIANGASWGFRVVSPNAPFTEARPYGDQDDILKAMVILTDGTQTMGPSDNTASDRAYGPYGYRGEAVVPGFGPRIAGGNIKSALDEKLAQTCAAAKAKDVIIYTITFDLNDSDTQDLMRDCATDADKYYDVAAASQLTPAFRAIAGSLGELRITD